MDASTEPQTLRPPAKAAATELLRSMKDDLQALGAAEVWLFGSVARGDDGPDSDIDIAVRMKDRFDWQGWCDIGWFLAPRFSRRVDLATIPLESRLQSVASEDLVRVF